MKKQDCLKVKDHGAGPTLNVEIKLQLLRYQFPWIYSFVSPIFPSLIRIRIHCPACTVYKQAAIIFLFFWRLLTLDTHTTRWCRQCWCAPACEPAGPGVRLPAAGEEGPEHRPASLPALPGGGAALRLQDPAANNY